LKNAFDAGEDGLGRNANSLVLGCDCLGVIHYFDANLVRDSGDLFVIKNAVRWLLVMLAMHSILIWWIDLHA